MENGLALSMDGSQDGGQLRIVILPLGCYFVALVAIALALAVLIILVVIRFGPSLHGSCSLLSRCIAVGIGIRLYQNIP